MRIEEKLSALWNTICDISPDYWKGVVVGMCDVWFSSWAKPKQQEKSEGRQNRRGKRVCNYLLESWCVDDLYTGERFLFMHFLSLPPLSISFFATHHLPAPRHILFTPLYYATVTLCWSRPEEEAVSLTAAIFIKESPSSVHAYFQLPTFLARQPNS